MTDEKQQLYRLKWEAVRTGASGYGTGKFTLDDAKKLVFELNMKNYGITHHSYERIEEEEGENDG